VPGLAVLFDARSFGARVEADGLLPDNLGGREDVPDILGEDVGEAIIG